MDKKRYTMTDMFNALRDKNLSAEMLTPDNLSQLRIWLDLQELYEKIRDKKKFDQVLKEMFLNQDIQNAISESVTDIDSATDIERVDCYKLSETLRLEIRKGFLGMLKALEESERDLKFILAEAGAFAQEMTEAEMKDYNRIINKIIKK